MAHELSSQIPEQDMGLPVPSPEPVRVLRLPSIVSPNHFAGDPRAGKPPGSSWVTDALSQGAEEHRRTAEIARLNEPTARAQAQEAAEKQTEREKQEELARLKRLLDERGAKDLLEQIQAQIGGDIIFKSTPPHDQSLLLLWAAYGLVKSEVVGPTMHHRIGGRSTTEWRSGNTSEGSSGRDYARRVDHTFHRFSETPIATSRIALGAMRTKYGNVDKEELYLLAGKRVYDREVDDSVGRGEEIPLLLRYLPSIPGLIKHETRFHADESEGNDYTLDMDLTYGDHPERLLLPDGRIIPQAFDLAPGGNYVGAPIIDIGDNPDEDREAIRELLAEGLRGI